MPSRMRAIILAGVAALGLGCGGCRHSNSSSQTGQNPGTMGADKDQTTEEQNLTGKVTGKNWHIPWSIHDAKGRTVPALVADAREGEMDNLQDGYTMRLHIVQAQLFQEGVHAADIQADQVEANSNEHKIIGTGNVRVYSLTNPPDTVITADKITWDPHSSTMEAVGHAHVTQRPHNGGPPISQTGGRITFDTKFQKIKVEAL